MLTLSKGDESARIMHSQFVLDPEPGKYANNTVLTDGQERMVTKENVCNNLTNKSSKRLQKKYLKRETRS